MKSYIFKVVIEKEEDGRYSAYCPTLPGCNTWGKTLEEALANIQEAARLYVEDLIASGEEIPSDEVIEAPAVSVAL